MSASCKLSVVQKRRAVRVEVAPVKSRFSVMPFDVIGEQSVRLVAFK